MSAAPIKISLFFNPIEKCPNSKMALETCERLESSSNNYVVSYYCCTEKEQVDKLAKNFRNSLPLVFIDDEYVGGLKEFETMISSASDDEEEDDGEEY